MVPNAHRRPRSDSCTRLLDLWVLPVRRISRHFCCALGERAGACAGCDGCAAAAAKCSSYLAIITPVDVYGMRYNGHDDRAMSDDPREGGVPPPSGRNKSPARAPVVIIVGLTSHKHSLPSTSSPADNRRCCRRRHNDVSTSHRLLYATLHLWRAAVDTGCSVCSVARRRLSPYLFAIHHALTLCDTCHLIDYGFTSRSTHKKDHFGGVLLLSQSLGLVLKKLNPTQKQETTQKQNGKKHTKSKPKSKENLNLNQQSTVRTGHVCVCIILQLLYTVQHRTVLIIFRLILHTIIIAQMLSTGREAEKYGLRFCDSTSFVFAMKSARYLRN